MSDIDDMDRWPDDELLREARGGNNDAFVVFCSRVLPSLKRYVEYQCREKDIPRHHADDFCQEAILRAVEFIKTHDDPPRHAVAWVKRIASNLIVDFERRRGRIRFTAAPSEFEDLVETNSQDELEEALEFFQWLKPEDRELLELIYIEQLTVEEAGQRLGLGKWNALKKHTRALQTLRDLIELHGQKPLEIRQASDQ
jgi:RNA polymerase sigma factor (sigma-70 family)